MRKWVMNLTKIQKIKIYGTVFLVLLSACLYRVCMFEQYAFLYDGDSLAAASQNISISRLFDWKNNELESNGILFYVVSNYYKSFNKDLEDSLSKIIVPDRYESCRLSDFDNKYLHLLPLLFSILSVFLMFMTGRKLGGMRTGILSTLFFAFHGSILSSVAYFRFYQMIIFFSILSSYLLLILLEKKKHILFWGILYVLSWFISLSSMINSIFLLPSHFVFWCINQRSKLHKGIYVFLPILFYFFALWMLDFNALQRKTGYGPVNSINFFDYISNIFGIRPVDLDAIPSLFIFPTYEVCLLLLFLIMIFAYLIIFMIIIKAFNIAKCLNKLNIGNSLIFPSLLVCLPFSLMYLFSLCFVNIINFYQFSLSIIYPGAALLLGSITSIIPKVGRWLILTIVAISSIYYYPLSYGEDKIIIIDILKNNIMINDIVLTYDLETKNALLCSSCPAISGIPGQSLKEQEFFNKIFYNTPHHIWVIFRERNNNDFLYSFSKTTMFKDLLKEGCIPKLRFSCGDYSLYYFSLPARLESSQQHY